MSTSASQADSSSGDFSAIRPLIGGELNQLKRSKEVLLTGSQRAIREYDPYLTGIKEKDLGQVPKRLAERAFRTDCAR